MARLEKALIDSSRIRSKNAMSPGDGLSELFSLIGVEQSRLLKDRWRGLAYPSPPFLGVSFRPALQNATAHRLPDQHSLVTHHSRQRVFDFSERLIDFLLIFWFFVSAIPYNECRELGTRDD